MQPITQTFGKETLSLMSFQFKDLVVLQDMYHLSLKVPQRIIGLFMLVMRFQVQPHKQCHILKQYNL